MKTLRQKQQEALSRREANLKEYIKMSSTSLNEEDSKALETKINICKSDIEILNRKIGLIR